MNDGSALFRVVTVAKVERVTQVATPKSLSQSKRQWSSVCGSTYLQDFSKRLGASVTSRFVQMFPSQVSVRITSRSFRKMNELHTCSNRSPCSVMASASSTPFSELYPLRYIWPRMRRSR